MPVAVHSGPVESSAVVRDAYAKHLLIGPKAHLDARGSRMLRCVVKSLPYHLIGEQLGEWEAFKFCRSQE